MRSLQSRFETTQDACMNLGSFFCFAKAIRKQGFSVRTIRYWFKKLVPTDDYDPRDRKKLLKYLYDFTKK